MINEKHQNQKRILGVDGGGSKTIAWIAEFDSSSDSQKLELEVIGRGNAGPSNPRSVGFDGAFANLDTAIKMARDQVPNISQTIDSACLSLAGVGRSEEQERIHEWAVANRLAKQIIVVDDVEPLRFAAMHEQGFSLNSVASRWEKSITLVVGTGSIACGRNEALQAVRVGGWGYLLGDEGSGFAIGLAGLKTLCKAHDRSEAPTDFQKALLHGIQLSSPTGLVGFVYQSPLPRAQIAELSEVVLCHAEIDPIAKKIVADSIIALTELVANTAQRLKLGHRTYSLALSGGIVTNHPVVVDRLLLELERIQLAPDGYHVVQEPIYGSLSLAMRLE